MSGDWEKILALVGTWAGAIATFSVVVYYLWQDRSKRPKLLISFENDRDVKSQGHTVGLPASTHSRWLRVRVENANRRNAAKNCRAYLIGLVKLLPDGNTLDMLPNDVRPLGWMHHDPASSKSGLDLLPGVAHWVDVVASRNDYPVLEVRAYPQCPQELPGFYVVTVQVSAEGADPVSIKIKVSCDGKWESLCGQKLS